MIERGGEEGAAREIFEYLSLPLSPPVSFCLCTLHILVGSKRELSPFLPCDGVNKRQGFDKRAERQREMSANKHTNFRSPGDRGEPDAP